MSDTTEDELVALRCSEYPLCGLSAWGCDQLQSLVYEKYTNKRREMALEIREDASEYIQAECNQAKKDLLAEVREKVISRAKPEPLPAGSVVFVDNDESTEKACYDLGIDIYERNLLAAIKEIEEGL